MKVKVMILLMMRLALMMMVGYDDDYDGDEHNGDDHNVKMVMNKFVMLFKVNQ